MSIRPKPPVPSLPDTLEWAHDVLGRLKQHVPEAAALVSQDLLDALEHHRKGSAPAAEPVVDLEAQARVEIALAEARVRTAPLVQAELDAAHVPDDLWDHRMR